MLRVHSIESFGTHDGPGVRYVIFLQGCLFRCVYCHNPDTIALQWWEEISVDTMVERVLRTKDYFGTKWGVTVSWWEPLLQARALLPFFKALHSHGIHITLDTNWYVRNEDVEALLEETDLVLLDVKHISNAQHERLTGKWNAPVLSFAQHLAELKKPVWLRYVFVPWRTDQEKALVKWAETLSVYKNIERAEILPYHRLGEYKWKTLGRKYVLDGVQPPASEALQKCKDIFERYFPVVHIR